MIANAMRAFLDPTSFAEHSEQGLILFGGALILAET